jgi:hypothetical protein
MAKMVIFNRGKTQSLPRQNIQRNSTDPYRHGTWCKVLKRYSVDHTVDVETAEGFTVTRVPVSSREWVTVEDPILGERNLPPVSSIVFMFMPTGGIDNAFIMGSCFLPSYDKHVKEFLVEGKEDEGFAKLEGGWQRTFDKVTGDLEVVGTDEDEKTITITIKKSEKKIQITDWNDNDLVVDEKGIKVTDTKGNTTTWDDSGTKFEDKNKNKITTSSTGIVMEDKSGQTVEMAVAGITIKSAVKIKLDCAAGVSIVTSDSAIWQPNIVPACPFGFSHGGPSAGIVLLKGS